MKNFDLNSTQLTDLAAESVTSRAAEDAALESHLVALKEQLANLGRNADANARADLQLQIARTLVGLERGAEAWNSGRPAFEVFIQARDWESAVDLCDVLFQTEQEGSLSALGQGIWLAVTLPIDPELSVTMLNHVVEDTPADSDGAAVAATTALFLVDVRAEGQQKDNLKFFAAQVLGNVARRHSQVETQEAFDLWMDRLELREPDKFLPRLRNVVDVLVQDDWWFDREALQAQLPVN
jgi:hypothetical protein